MKGEATWAQASEKMFSFYSQKNFLHWEIFLYKFMEVKICFIKNFETN